MCNAQTFLWMKTPPLPMGDVLFTHGNAAARTFGRAHRRRPYQSPLYICAQSHTNKITIYTQSTQTKPTIHTQSTQTKSTVPHAIHPNETVGAVPACPPERPHSGVSIPKIHASCAGILTMDAPLWGDTGGHIGTAPTHFHQTTRCAPTASRLYFR